MKRYLAVIGALILLIGIISLFLSRYQNKVEKTKIKDTSFKKALIALEEGREEEAWKMLETIFSKSNSPQALKAGLKLLEIYEKEMRFRDARDICRKLIEKYPMHPAVGKLQQKLWDLNLKVLFSPFEKENATYYLVQPKDTLIRIAKMYNTTVALIKRCNELTSDKILPGQKLKIIKGKFDIVIDKSQNTLMLRLNGKILKVYKVSTGMNNSTPTGKFKIVNKVVNPIWYRQGAVVPPDSPENILGSRWMGFNIKGYGIHGTTQPDTVGKHITRGCVRMYNPDVEELYDIVPIGTEVTILD